MPDMTARHADPRIRAARVSHPVFARIFPRLSQAMEDGGMAACREPLLAALTGQVIDIGAGTGASFGHYPSAVDHVTAVEPEPLLRQIAAAAARAAPVPVTDGLADALPAPDASFDAAVVTFVLCTVPDQDAALAEIRRVLKPGGLLCFLPRTRPRRHRRARAHPARPRRPDMAAPDRRLPPQPRHRRCHGAGRLHHPPARPFPVPRDPHPRLVLHHRPGGQERRSALLTSAEAGGRGAAGVLGA